MKKLLLLLLLVMAVPVTIMAEEVTIDGIKYDLVTKAKVAKVIKGGNYSGDIVIPSTVTYNNVVYNVTSIEDKAFYGSTYLRSIDIPNSVTSIGYCAFWSCKSLTSIDIPDGVTSIGNNAFEYCTGLTSIDIPDGVTSIGKFTFHGCTGLTSIDIPDGVTSIGDYAFEYCSSLTSIDIPNSVTSMGKWTFRGCTGLTSIDIPNSVTNIGEAAFLDCRNLTSVIIGDGVTSIGGSAFANCTGLTFIDIPNSVTSIEGAAFSGCTGLTSIDIPNSVTSIGGSAFANCNALEVVTCRATSVPSTSTDAFNDSYVEYATLIVPDEAYTAYSTRSPWSNFGTILKLSETSVITANSYTREYGDANPSEWNYTVVGQALNGEPARTCAADETSAPGTYPIVISKGTVTNEHVTYINGTLTVTKAPLTITANSYTIKEGDALPTFDAVFTGLKNGESESVVNPAITCTATDSNTPGTYDITVTATSDNYDITYVAGTLTILPTDVTITITTAGMATYCSPYDLDFSNVTGLKAYTITGYDRASQKVYAMRVYDVPAGTGLYLVGNQGDYTVNVGNSSSYYINMLVGTLTETWIEPTDGEYTNFRLTGTSPTNASFKALTQGRNFSANRAYLQIPTAVYNGTANAVGIIFDDEADSIETISMEDAGTDWFTLDGRKLNGKPTTKGIYVVNGRKVVIK